MPNNSPATHDVLASLRASLGRTSRAIITGSDPVSVARSIAAEARSLIHAAGVAVAVRLDDSSFRVTASAGSAVPDSTGGSLQSNHPLVRTALRTSRASSFSARVAGGSASYSAAVAPIVHDGRTAGALIAVNKPGGEAFTREQMRLFGIMAEQASLAFAGQRCREMLHAALRQQALSEAALTIAGVCGEPQQALQTTVQIAKAHFPARAAAVYLYNDERTHLFLAADTGLTEDERDVVLDATGRTARAIMRSKSPVMLKDFDGHVECPRGCAIGAPILQDSERVGALILLDCCPEACPQSEVDSVAVMARQCGLALARAWETEAAHRKADEANSLLELSQHVTAGLHAERVLGFIADSVLDLLRVDKFALMMFDRRHDRLVSRINRGLPADWSARMQPRTGEGIPGWVFEWMCPVAVSDVAADARNHALPMQHDGIASLVCVPMAVGEETIGVMLAMSSRRRLFTVAEMELLYVVATQGAAAIANANLYRDARCKSAEMRRYVHRIARALGSALESQDAPQLLADILIEVMRADRCAIYRVAQDGLRLHTVSRFPAGSPPEAHVPFGQGLAGAVSKSGRPIVVADVASDPRSSAHPWLLRESLTSFLGVPLKVGRRTVGVVEIFTTEPRDFSGDDVKLLNEFARRARAAQHLVVEGP